MKRLILICLAIALALNTPVDAQVASQNIPVLPVIQEQDDDLWYLKGDGYLQRQVEPTIAVSTRNPDHLLSFFVDYRAVDVQDDVGLGEQTQTFASMLKVSTMLLTALQPLPDIPVFELPPVAAAEAWVGGSRSYDGGLTWSGFFMPGAPENFYPEGLGPLPGSDTTLEPIYGLDAATDPVAVAGPCGYVYVVFMAFTRGGDSKMVVARFQDLNDLELGETWQYQGMRVLESGNNATNGHFLDKPAIALDIFRDPADFSTYASNFSDYECGHRLYVSYSTFNGLTKDGKFQSKINFGVSNDAGQSWDLQKIQMPYNQNQGSALAVDQTDGTVYLVWRHFFDPDAILMVKTSNFGKKFSKPAEITGDLAMEPYDQLTISTTTTHPVTGVPVTPFTDLTFRSNGFPTAVVAPDGNDGSTLFVAWQEYVDVDPNSFTHGEPIPFDPENPYRSPRIVLTRSPNGGDTWTGPWVGPPAEDPNPGNYWPVRRAIDFADRDGAGAIIPPPGFGALPQERFAGPQVMPWLSFGGGKMALAYHESRGLFRGPDGSVPYEIVPWDLSGLGFISGINRVVDFRAALLDPATGRLQGTTQVSRYPISLNAILGDGEQVTDIAPVAPPACATGTGSGPAACEPSVSFHNKPQSGSGGSPFMGDYPGMSPIVQFFYDYDPNTDSGEWKWATEPAHVPYQAFHVVFADNRHLIPATDTDTSFSDLEHWSNYQYYDPENCINIGSRNTDVLTARIDAELVVSAPTTYKYLDERRGFPVSIFNRSGDTRFYRLTIVKGTDVASFAVDEALGPVLSGKVEIFAYSSVSQMVYVDAWAIGQIQILVEQVDENNVLVPGGETGYATLNPDPSNDYGGGSEQQNPFVVNEGVTNPFVVNPFVVNPFVVNPFVVNPFVVNPFVVNTAIEDKTVYKVIDNTWSIQADALSTSSSYLPVINIDNAEQLLGNYAFQLLVYKISSYGGPTNCAAENIGQAQILSNVSQHPTNSTYAPFVVNPFVVNPFVVNPFVVNPFVVNSTFTMAPSDQTFEGTAKNLQIPGNGTLGALRAEEKIYATLRAFQLVSPLPEGALEYKPDVDEPAFTAIATPCLSGPCIYSVAPDLEPINVSTDTNLNQPVPTGTTLTFDWTLFNNGNVFAEAENRDLRHAFFLSKDATVELGLDDEPVVDPVNGTDLRLDVRIGTTGDFADAILSQSLTLAAQGTEDFTGVEVQIPTSVNPADFDYLILFVDDYREISEVDELNNQHPMAIELIKLNHAPTFTAEWLARELEEDAADTTYPGWASVIDDGDDDVIQTLEFIVTDNTNPALFEVGPAIDASTGELSFTLAENAFGTATISVVLRDDGGTANGGSDTSDTVQFTITVNPVNDPPIITEVIIGDVFEDTPTLGEIVIDDPDNDSFEFSLNPGPSHGTVTFGGPQVGSFTYEPTENYNGDDEFTVVVSDTSGSGSATVKITIIGVEDIPVAYDQTIGINEDTSTPVTLDAYDGDGDPLTFTYSDPLNGVLVGTAPNLTYTPNAHFAGVDSFTFQVNDGDDDSNVANVTINVAAINDIPVAYDIPDATTAEDTPLQLTLAWDADGDPLTLILLSGPTHGTLSDTAPVATYTPNEDFFGADSFTFTVSDPHSPSNEATVNITVTAQPDFKFLGLQDPWQEIPLYTVKVGSAVPIKWQYSLIDDPSDTPIDSSEFFPRVNITGSFPCNQPEDGPTNEYPNFPGASDYQYNPSTFTQQFNWDTDAGTIGECYNIYVFNPVDGISNGPFKIKIKK